MSGSLGITKSELMALLTNHPDTAVVGVSAASLAAARRTGTAPEGATVSDLLRQLADFVGETVWIEEQDHSYYVMHLAEEKAFGPPDKWIIVKSDSPVFQKLRDRHRAGNR
jgi:hypothetical protein